MIHYWYRLLENIFAGKDGLHIVITKLVVDQVIFSPVFFVVYYIYMALWDGNMDQVPKKINNELVPVSIDSAKVWVPVQVRILHLAQPHCSLVSVSRFTFPRPTRLLFHHSNHLHLFVLCSVHQLQVHPRAFASSFWQHRCSRLEHLLLNHQQQEEVKYCISNALLEYIPLLIICLAVWMTHPRLATRVRIFLTLSIWLQIDLIDMGKVDRTKFWFNQNPTTVGKVNAVVAFVSSYPSLLYTWLLPTV